MRAREGSFTSGSFDDSPDDRAFRTRLTRVGALCPYCLLLPIRESCYGGRGEVLPGVYRGNVRCCDHCGGDSRAGRPRTAAGGLSRLATTTSCEVNALLRIHLSKPSEKILRWLQRDPTERDSGAFRAICPSAHGPNARLKCYSSSYSDSFRRSFSHVHRMASCRRSPDY